MDLSICVVRQNKDISKDKKDMMPWEQCIQFAQWIPCGINMFCILKDVFHMEPLIEIMRNSTLNDSDVDDDLIAWDSLANISKDVQDQLLHTHKMVLARAPYLHELVKGGAKKSRELRDILDDMQYMIGQVQSEDLTHLKKSIVHYSTFDSIIRSSPV
ncbi:hypothetical protein EV424DRAFT_1542585 [Suillus variegatus]|nr:hypothetical protein EV424DRAFT_1542585 [Suillus variegatus]